MARPTSFSRGGIRKFSHLWEPATGPERPARTGFVLRWRLRRGGKIVIVDEIEVRTRDTHAELSARVRSGALDEPFRLWYRFPHSVAHALRPSGSAFMAAALMPSMALGEPLEIAAPVSPRLLVQCRLLMDVHHTWWPELEVVPVRAAREPRPLWPSRRKPSACFFTLGVDSFYTLLRNLDGTKHGTTPIESLLFVAGFDVRLGNEALLETVDANLAAAAAATHTRVMRVDTNLRDLTDPIVSWNRYHGAAMASVGLALERTFGALYASSSYGYRYLPPWGSHPLTDHLWSTQRVRFIHDGNEAIRPEKIEYIAHVPVVQQTLRTCWENRDNRYNCGECEKCLRTMASFEGLGVLPAMETFPDTFPAEALDTLDWTDPDVIRRFDQVLRHIPVEDSTESFREAIRTRLDGGGPTGSTPRS